MTATMGMTTAIAMVAPLLRPPEPFPDADGLRADGVDDALVDVLDVVDTSETLGVNVTTGDVEVIVVMTGP